MLEIYTHRRDKEEYQITSVYFGLDAGVMAQSTSQISSEGIESGPTHAQATTTFGKQKHRRPGPRMLKLALLSPWPCFVSPASSGECPGRLVSRPCTMRP